jgi:ubiquinone/menaquinone biosynthesis C-methylase UbiE
MSQSKKSYHPEPYWSEVAKRIAGRKGRSVIAGDDEPYYRYKRERFLELLHSVDFYSKKVLELGPGPGGNLSEVLKQNPVELHGADISQDMIDLATRHLTDPRVHLTKIDGQNLPFENGAFDIVFTATVLQHNTDEDMLRHILSEICRVSKDQVVLFEMVAPQVTGDELCMSRPPSFYAKICREHGFQLKEVQHINIYASYLLAGFTRKVLNPSSRKEGEPLTAFSRTIQRLGLPFTKQLDKVFKVRRDVAKLGFVKAVRH